MAISQAEKLKFEKQLKRKTPENSTFGTLDKNKFNEINIELEKRGLQKLETTEISVSANIIQKLQKTRINKEGFTTKEVTDSIASALHNKKSRVMGSNIAFIAKDRKTKKTVFASGYYVKTVDI